MSEELARTDWAEPEVMAFWREEVRKRAEVRLAECPTAKLAPEIATPDNAAEALYLLSQGGMTKKKIGLKTGIHPGVLWGMERHHAGSLAESLMQRKPRLAARYLHLAEKTAELIERKIDLLEDDEEELKKTNIKDVALTLGIINDKALNLAGMATIKIEHVRSSGMEEYEALREAARQRLAGNSIPIEAEVIEHGAEMAEA